ncbi:protein-l-isoaspartate o-methyltransferase [Plasmopara halstedii]|uniref:protein-L-isoaspartate(D-aspartate) O-methyltransferase n=1 Tax=Plasmopara halstedii TaxID=4781 RepID=A0A0P1A7D4_PLAHL|nr:protein-l-isoaspartate o-methyltransferase [Plasmopara halstedii]CEG36181.1 protein-l-isoaspartate o-methyltransferase [Plasmopara halstedii]|eukprot:XP_024572550.1 protein-l-isoaspartate o-methyltransferase [Plasmopara halstedii]
MTFNDSSDLPLLQPRSRTLIEVNESAQQSTSQSTLRKSRLDYWKICSIGAILGSIGFGIFVSAAVLAIKLDVYTHNKVSMHAFQDYLDIMATCASTGSAEENKNKPKVLNKGVGWLLGGNDPEHVLTSLPKISLFEDLPDNWDWRNYNGTGISLTTSVMNQMVPRACGSCWAFATVSALSDRIRIARYRKTGRLDTEVLLSPQVLLDCGMRSFGSCHGGDPRYAHKWIYENGIVDMTCNPYIASHPSWMGGGDCASTQCHTCNLKGECFVLENPVKYRISEYGTLNFTTSEEFQLQAMNEIYHRGPIVVSMYSLAPKYRQFKGGYILRDSTKYSGTTHVVSLVGWGTDAETGVKYWIVRNSDGTNWGDDGFFAAERGVNIYNIESHGAWAVPIVYVSQDLLVSTSIGHQIGGDSHATLVESLVRTNVVASGSRLEAALRRVDRRDFVAPEFRDSTSCYDNRPLKIGTIATISTPQQHAQVLRLLEPHLQPGMTALDVGCGSGFLVAAMALLVSPGGFVTGIDIVPALVKLSKANLLHSLGKETAFKQTEIIVSNGKNDLGLPINAQYDCIHVGVAVETKAEAESFLKLVKPGGGLLIPFGSACAEQKLIKVLTKYADGSVDKRFIMNVLCQPMLDSTADGATWMTRAEKLAQLESDLKEWCKKFESSASRKPTRDDLMDNDESKKLFREFAALRK